MTWPVGVECPHCGEYVEATDPGDDSGLSWKECGECGAHIEVALETGDIHQVVRPDDGGGA